MNHKGTEAQGRKPKHLRSAWTLQGSGFLRFGGSMPDGLISVVKRRFSFALLLFVAALGCATTKHPSGLTGAWFNIRSHEEEVTLYDDGSGRLRDLDWLALKWSYDSVSSIVTITYKRAGREVNMPLHYDAKVGELFEVIDRSKIAPNAPPMATWVLYNSHSRRFEHVKKKG